MKLIFHVLSDLDVNTRMHRDPSDNLLSNEISGGSKSALSSASVIICHDVPDFHLVQSGLVVLVDVDVDGEMRIDVAHLVPKSFGDADDQVVDEGPNGAESSDILAGAVVQFDMDHILCRVRKGDREMTEVLRKFA